MTDLPLFRPSLPLSTGNQQVKGQGTPARSRGRLPERLHPPRFSPLNPPSETNQYINPAPPSPPTRGNALFDFCFGIFDEPKLPHRSGTREGGGRNQLSTTATTTLRNDNARTRGAAHIRRIYDSWPSRQPPYGNRFSYCYD